MNFNRDASVYNRRKAFMNRQCSGYLNMGIQASRESLDEEEGSDAGSIQSTTSSRSYRTWKRAQKKKQKARKLERAQSLFGDPTDHFNASRTSFDPFTFGSRTIRTHSQTSHRSAEEKRNSFRSSQSSSVDLEFERSEIDAYVTGRDVYNELSTIIQSPVEPFYSSSDLDTSSDDDSKPEFPSDVAHVKHWPNSDEHKDTRDWLISGSFDANHQKREEKPTKPIHQIIVSKSMNKPERFIDPSLKPRLIEGLNELTSLMGTESQQVPIEVDESKEEARMDEPTSGNADVAVACDASVNSITTDDVLCSTPNDAVTSPLGENDPSSLSASLMICEDPPSITGNDLSSPSFEEDAMNLAAPVTEKEDDVVDDATSSICSSYSTGEDTDIEEEEQFPDIVTRKSETLQESALETLGNTEMKVNRNSFGENVAEMKSDVTERDFFVGENVDEEEAASSADEVDDDSHQSDVVKETEEVEEEEKEEKEEEEEPLVANHDATLPLCSNPVEEVHPKGNTTVDVNESPDPTNKLTDDDVIKDPPTSGTSSRRRTLPLATSDKSHLCCCCIVM